MQGVVARETTSSNRFSTSSKRRTRISAALTGPYYGLISEYKCDDADTVFVSLGSAAENIEAAVDQPARPRESERRLDPHQRLPSVPEAAVARRSPGKRTSSSSSGPTSRWRATTRSARDVRTALKQGAAGCGRDSEDYARADADDHRRQSTVSARATSAPSTPLVVRVRHRTRARKDGKRASDGATFMVLASIIRTK